MYTNSVNGHFPICHWDHFKHYFAVTALNLKKVTSNPDTLQKVCILIHSFIHGINLTFQTNYLLRLVKILDYSQSFDFYGFCRLPHYLSHRFSADQVEDEPLLNELISTLRNNQPPNINEDQLATFARNSLLNFLNMMAVNDIAFSSEQEIRQALQSWIITHPIENLTIENVDLSRLRISLKKTDWLVIITDVCFIVADILCIPDFLNQWKLIQLPTFEQIQGRHPILSKTPFHSIDNYVRVFMSIGFVLQFTQAAIALCKTDLSRKERIHAKWMLAASVGEFIYNVSILRKIDPRLIALFAFWAKLLGLVTFFKTPKPTFLE